MGEVFSYDFFAVNEEMTLDGMKAYNLKKAYLYITHPDTQELLNHLGLMGIICSIYMRITLCVGVVECMMSSS